MSFIENIGDYMGTIIVMAGKPASGKSSIAENLEQVLVDAKWISRDEIRFSLLQPGEDYFAHEDEVLEKFWDDIAASVQEHEYTIIDATHLSRKARMQLFMGVGNSLAANQVTFVWVNCSTSECLRRNAKRKGMRRVPDATIYNFSRITSFPDESWIDDIICVDGEESVAENVEYILNEL